MPGQLTFAKQCHAIDNPRGTCFSESRQIVRAVLNCTARLEVRRRFYSMCFSFVAQFFFSISRLPSVYHARSLRKGYLLCTYMVTEPKTSPTVLLLLLILTGTPTYADTLSPAAPSYLRLENGNSDPLAGLPFSQGAILAADYGNEPNAINVWKYITDGYHLGPAPYDPSTDPQITFWSNGGDPLPALNGQLSPAYRRIHSAGNQSIWDAERGRDQTRAQMGGWIARENMHIFPLGKRQLLAFSVRLDETSPIEYDIDRCSGNYQCSMVMQIKSSNPVKGPWLKIYQGRNGLRLMYNADVQYNDYLPDLPRKKWLRILLDVYWSDQSDGAYRWWGDIDGDNVRQYVPLSPKRNVPTIHAGSTGAAANFGPYHGLNVPRNGADYGNIEILDHPVNDPW